jgi:polysaccharide biosynthesis transport protein
MTGDRHLMAEFGTDPTLRTYLTLLRRRKWWVIAMALLGLAVSLAISLSQPKEYSATAQLLVQFSGTAVNVGSAQQQVTPTDVQTELQLATSAPVLRVVRSKLGSTPPAAASEIAQTNVIALTAVSPTPAGAARVANAYATAFVTYTRGVAISSLTAAEAQLRSKIHFVRRQIRSLQHEPSAAAEVSALANQEAVLKEQIAQLEVNGAVATSGVEFVTPAQAPTSPSSPRPARDAVLGLAAGLMLGLGAAFLRDGLDEALSSKEVVERLGGAPVLALVPMVSSWKKRDQPLVVSAVEPTSPAAEAYRSLRTSLQFVRQARDLRTLLVTSPVAAEGKSSTLANLGTVFAQAGERVVLVSCDLRRPRLGQFFGLEEESGLTAVLVGRQSLQDALRPVNGYENLWLLSAGRIPPNPAELLSGPKSREIFAALKANFDLVLVDSPPALPVTDAMVLSKYADGTLLVVAAGRTRRTELQRTAEKFAQMDAPVVGIVLNQVTRQTGYGGGYGYGYGYGYGSYTPNAVTVSAPVPVNGKSGAHPAMPGGIGRGSG